MPIPALPRFPLAAVARRVLPPLLLLVAATTGVAVARPATDEALPGLRPEYLDAAFWVARLDAPDRPLLDAAARERFNAAMRERDPSFHRLEALPATLEGTEVRARVEALSAPLPPERWTADGRPLDDTARRTLREALALDAIPAAVTPRFGLVVRRSALRTYPTTQRLFSRPGDTDIDRLQESALFPGDAVAALHASRDGRWHFVVSERYAAWIASDAIAFGTRTEVLEHGARQPALVVVGARAHTVHTPEQPALSALVLDMGLRLPVRADWPPDQPVNGQLPLAAHVVDLPLRRADGTLAFAPALIARSEPVADAPLPATPANLIRQAFRFLGERYGWGHDYGTRDCSGFVSEVFRSLGVQLPRNTRDQAVSPIPARTALEGADTATRARALAALVPGDLVYIPGHVMLVIGRIGDEPWLIHDAHGLSLADGRGGLRRLPVNGVVVTPLRPLRADATTPLSDRITAIQRLRNPPAP